MGYVEEGGPAKASAPPTPPVSRAIVDVIPMGGYSVQITQEGETYHAVATRRDGHTRTAEGTNMYLGVCALAEKVGIDLEDS